MSRKLDYLCFAKIKVKDLLSQVYFYCIFSSLTFKFIISFILLSFNKKSTKITRNMSDFQSFLFENIKNITDSTSDHSDNSLNLNEFFKSKYSLATSSKHKKSHQSFASLDSPNKSRKSRTKKPSVIFFY